MPPTLPCPLSLDRILVSTDNSPASQGAVNAALDLARACGGRIFLLYVLEFIPPYDFSQPNALGMAPGANIGDSCAVFEATHGSAPKYAGLDKVNPGSMLLSGAMMFRRIGWNEAADLIERGLSETIQSGVVTYDLARLLPGSTEASCSGFAKAIIDWIKKQ